LLIPSAFTVTSDPWGRVITDAGESYGPVTFDLKQESPSNVVCDVDVDEMESIQERMPIQRHRDAAPFEWRLPFLVAGLMVMDIVLLQKTS
jgi:predicted amidohydrolase